MVVAGCRNGEPARLPIAETVIVSTCNRLEVYAAAKDAVRARADIESALCAASGGRFEQIRPALYSLEGCRAARHLMRVTAGLDSMVLGETQILGQVGNALGEASEQKTAGALLSRLFTSAIHTARLAHAQTAIGRFPTSVSHAAVKLLADRFRDIAKLNILLVGAGTIATITARVLEKHGAASLAFISRTQASAAAAAEQFAGTAYRWDELRLALAWADVVIVATGAAHPVIFAQSIEPRASLQRPLLILDLAVPPNVDAAVAELEGVQLLGIDDLDSTVVENLEKRRAAIPDVERLIDRELDQFMSWWTSRRVAPLITDLHRKLEHVANQELELALGGADRLDPEQRQVITRLVHRVTKKLLHEPTVRLKSLHAESSQFHNAVRHLFGLGERDSATGGT
jgi:glutamyl-tRNA reductase